MRIDESNVWGLRRYVTLIVVLALHGALFTLFMSMSLARGPTQSAPHAVELLLLPPPVAPRIVAPNSRLLRLTGATAIALVPPVIESLVTSPSQATSAGPASVSEGNGAAVDWAAEAHRALQAFEIRNHQPKSDMLVSSSPAEDHWWPRTRHHAGDQFKTAGGDWIIWIDSNCYQVAGSKANVFAPGSPPRTICLRDPASPRGDSPD